MYLFWLNHYWSNHICVWKKNREMQEMHLLLKVSIFIERHYQKADQDTLYGCSLLHKSLDAKLSVVVFEISRGSYTETLFSFNRLLVFLQFNDVLESPSVFSSDSQIMVPRPATSGLSTENFVDVHIIRRFTLAFVHQSAVCMSTSSPEDSDSHSDLRTTDVMSILWTQCQLCK